MGQSSFSVRRSGKAALSHPEVVDLIRDALSDGILTADELADLAGLAAPTSIDTPGIPARSKGLLWRFIFQVNATVGGRGPYTLASAGQRVAADLVCDFLRRSGPAMFPKLDRDEVGVGLLMRIANPALMDQGDASLCGPTALVYNLATDRPTHYARYAIDLYETGKAVIGGLRIEPRPDCRAYLPPAGAIHPADWLTTASLRDSENWFLDYDTVQKETAGATLPGELADWFRRAGYTDVRAEANLVFTKNAGTIDEANRLLAGNYHVCLFIDDQVCHGWSQTKSSVVPSHWVVLRSPIVRSRGTVDMTVFTWGQGDYAIPHGAALSEADFLKNFYGYVAAKL